MTTPRQLRCTARACVALLCATLVAVSPATAQQGDSGPLALGNLGGWPANTAVVVAPDQTVWSWGYAPDGVSVASSNPYLWTQRERPVQIPNFTGVTSVSFRFGHMMFRKSNGSVWAWGWNGLGQLGTYPNGHQYGAPVAISMPAIVVAMATGESHSVMLAQDGGVWAAGSNSAGQCGATSLFWNVSLPSFTPIPVVQVAGPGAGVAIAAGQKHTIILRPDSSVWCVGENLYGQLGSGGTVATGGAAVRAGTLTNIVGITAGDSTSYALRGDGTVWSWGSNAHGALGVGQTATALDHVATPTQVVGLPAMVAIEAAGFGAAGIDSTGHVWQWGWQTDCPASPAGLAGEFATPVLVPGISGAVTLAVGRATQCVLVRLNDGSLVGWGAGLQFSGVSSSGADCGPAQIAAFRDAYLLSESNWALPGTFRLRGLTARAPSTWVVTLLDVATGTTQLGTAGTSQLAFTSALLPLVDATGLFGPSLPGTTTTVQTDPFGTWNWSVGLPNDPSLHQLTFFVETYALAAWAPNGYFFQSDLATVTIP